MEWLHRHAEPKPDRSIVPANESFEAVLFRGIVPRAFSRCDLQKPARQEFDCKKTGHVDESAQRPCEVPDCVVHRLIQENDQTIDRKHPYIAFSAQTPVFVSGRSPRFDSGKNDFKTASRASVNQKAKPYGKGHNRKLYSIISVL